MSTHCRIHADQERYASKMEITIEPYGWGEARPHDVGALLFDVASQLNRLVREPFAGPIRVVPAPCHDFIPMIHYRIYRRDPITIQLAARDRSWSQFAYQFAHEFCHALSNYELLRDNPNKWFHEALCELASVFTLRKMAETWPTQPPYPNWADYVGSLASYADNLLSDQERQLPPGMSLGNWLSAHEEELRNDPYLRLKNAVVAYTLLPIFEHSPEGWNAIRKLPTSAGTLAEYLAAWHQQVDEADQPFVKRLMGAFQ